MTTPSLERPAVRYATKPSDNYALIVALFCSLLLISNIAATKLIGFDVPLPWREDDDPWQLITDGGAVLFPLTYVLGDVLSEVYGLKRARRAIFAGFAIAALASVTFLLVAEAPAGPGYENQDAFVAVLGFVPQIVVASLVAFVVGQFLNSYVLVRLKNQYGERRLWARLMGSTLVGEIVDTTLFGIIAFGGLLSGGELFDFIWIGVAYKVTVEVAMLPATYAIIAKLKRIEGISN